MSQEIKQTLGIDATKALETLRQLDVGFKAFEDRLTSVANAIQKYNGVSKTAQKTVLATSLSKTSTEAVRLTQNVEKLTVSTGLIARILTTQLTVSIFGKLRRELADAGREAAAFQKSIALTGTIARGATFDQIADSVRNLSDSFNLPLLEASAGVYQTLSNQVGNFGESVKFAAEAARFAKATNSSFADSVDLLSAALKGYNLTVDDTDKVSSIFFATIDRGRINASELANSFGRIDTIAADLGVSLEETGSALAAISVRGTKTSEALTQLRAILTSLTKPSSEMRRTLDAAGFSSSEVAIKTLGLTGVLDLLAKSTNGSQEQLSKLLPNVRALSGASSLSSDDLRSLSDNIREMTQAGRGFNKEKFLQATATDAERVTGNLNKLKNEIKLGLGNAALSTADDLFRLVGGADNLIKTGKVAIPTLTGIAGAMVLLKGSTMAANAELSVMSKALGALALIPVAAGVGSSIGSFLENQRLDSLFADLNTLRSQDAKYLAEFAATQGKQRDEFNRTNEARVQAALQANLALNKLYLQDVANAQSAEEKKRAFDKFAARSAVDEKALGLLLGRKLDSPDAVARGLIDAQKQAAQLRTQLDQALAGEEGINRLRGNLDQVFKDLERLAPNRSLIGGDKGEGLRAQYANVLDMLKRLRTDGNITAEELQKVIKFRNSLGQDALTGGGVANTGFMAIEKLGFASTINALDEALYTYQEIQRIQSTIGNSTALTGQLTAFEGLLQQAAPGVQALTTGFQNTDLAARSVTNALTSANDQARQLATLARSTAESMQTAAAASQQIRAPGAVQSKYAGEAMLRPKYFANGGTARGVDTIPIMAAPGESIINADSTAKFFSQLQAINAGQRPIYRESGGNVTTGDINITVKGGDSTETTVRDIGIKLRREFRRGSLKR